MITISPFKVGKQHGIEFYRVTQEVVNWLVTNYGPAGERWFRCHNCIYFPDERDHVMCLLRRQ